MPSPTRAALDRETVVEVAADIANQEGLDAVTLTRVAAELGVKQPALYRHVDSHRDLIRLLSLRCRELLANDLRSTAVGISGDEAVRAVAHAWRGVAKSQPGLYEATDRIPSTGDPEAESAIDEIIAVLAQSLSGYDLGDDECSHAARSLRSAFHGFCQLEAVGGHPETHDLDETYASMIALLCRGLRS